MDLNQIIQELINMVIVPILLASLCLILPPIFIFIQFITTISRHFFPLENMEGKVALITGAATGIGEQLAYQYAKKGAALVIVDKKADNLPVVAQRARELGSPDVLTVCADVSNVNDCKSFVDEAIHHFGKLDHLVNNAGVASISPFERASDVTNLKPVMDVNFWGSIYPTHFAIPHLKNTKGKIVVMSSASAVMHPPTLSLYAASKSALLTFFESVRAEVAPAIKITIATPGFVDSNMTRRKNLIGDGSDEAKVTRLFPLMSSKACAGAIFEAVRQGEKYVTPPKWYKLFYLTETLCPQLVDCIYRLFYMYYYHPNPNPNSKTNPTIPAAVPKLQLPPKAD